MVFISTVYRRVLTLEAQMDKITGLELLSEIDRDFLSQKGYEGEVSKNGSEIHIILKGIPLSEIYIPQITDLLIKIPAGYPNANPDMFWTCPIIKYTNGTSPQATESRETSHNREWQRWSRHYPPNSWRPGVDGVASFLRLVISEFSKTTL